MNLRFFKNQAVDYAASLRVAFIYCLVKEWEKEDFFNLKKLRTWWDRERFPFYPPFCENKNHSPDSL